MRKEGSRLGRWFLWEVMLMTVLTAPTVASAREHIELRGVTLALGMPRDAVMKQLDKFSLQKEAKDDYWNIYSAPGSSDWIGSLLFKRGKLALVIKSWAKADDKTMNGVIKAMMVGHSSCNFILAATPTSGSPLKLTTLACPGRQVVMQVNDDQGAGVVKCGVEVLGDPGKILNDTTFWKACH